jgi:hypothetical protein
LDSIHFIPDNDRYPIKEIATFYNGWQNYSTAFPTTSFVPASYYIDDAKRVHLNSVLYPGTWTNGTLIFKLPNNLLPSQYMHIPSISSATSLFGIDYRDGVAGVIAKGSGSGYLTTPIMYYPASQDSKWTNLSLVNGWSTYNTAGAIPQYTSPQYTKSADGLVSLRGLIKNSGTPVYDTNIATLPAGFRPSARVLSNGVASGMYTRTDILTTGEIRFMTGSSSWTSLDGITFYADQ